jgi:hypothetical protein
MATLVDKVMKVMILTGFGEGSPGRIFYELGRMGKVITDKKGSDACIRA